MLLFCVEVVIDAHVDCRTSDRSRWVPEERCSVQTVTGRGKVVRRRVSREQASRLLYRSVLPAVLLSRIFDVVSANTAKRGRCRAQRNKQRARAWINQQRRVARDRRAANHERVSRVRNEVTEDSVACFVGVDDREPERLIDRLSEVDAVVLIAAEEEGLVLLDWPAQIKSELAQSDQRLGSVLRIRIPLVSIQRFVAKEVETGAVKVAACRCA